jgi:hypothetical protein
VRDPVVAWLAAFLAGALAVLAILVLIAVLTR